MQNVNTRCDQNRARAQSRNKQQRKLPLFFKSIKQAVAA